MMINKMASVNFVNPNNNYKFMQVIKPTIQIAPILLSQQNVHNHGCKILPLRCSSTSSPTIEKHSFSYKPSIWNLEFLKSLEKNHIKAQGDQEKIERLKSEVKNMVANEEHEPLMLFKLIDEIQRLGLGNYFNDDIKGALGRNAYKFSDLKLNLHATALGFRLLRQFGFLVSQDVFKQFMDANGNFKPSLRYDNEGLKHLYEASYLTFVGENLMDKVKAFTNMEYISNDLCLNESKHIIVDYMNHKLSLPLQYQVAKLEARHHIETLPQRDCTNNVRALLIELAMLDFNNMQFMYQDDLIDMSRWWKNMELSENLRFTRDRLVECFFWSIGITSSKPQLSCCRKALTKVCNFITIIDDIYDAYGHIHDLHLFTKAIERWNINEIDELPHYMKITFVALYNTINEIGYEILKLKGLNCIPFLINAWKEMCKAFMVEAQWCHYKETPSFEEYMENGWISSSGALLLTHAFFFVTSQISLEALQALKINHHILRLPSMVLRLTNDLVTSKDEIERGETTNAISCYAKHASVSHEDACKHITKMIDENWKRLNEIQVNNQTPFTKDFIETSMNLARTSQCVYQHGDGHGSPQLLHKKILSIIVEPIHLYPS